MGARRGTYSAKVPTLDIRNCAIMAKSGDYSVEQVGTISSNRGLQFLYFQNDQMDVQRE